MRRAFKQATIDLRHDFEADGIRFIGANWIRETEEEILPAIKVCTLTRYLYHVRCDFAAPRRNTLEVSFGSKAAVPGPLDLRPLAGTKLPKQARTLALCRKAAVL
mgnify:CR=1 FL=1|jgi:hypothetical protein